jgi:hypothetical protein
VNGTTIDRNEEIDLSPVDQVPPLADAAIELATASHQSDYLT